MPEAEPTEIPEEPDRNSNTRELMAGGISEALVTTMLGLMTAIPLVLLHSLLRDRSRGLIQVLEEQSAGLIAERAERETA